MTTSRQELHDFLRQFNALLESGKYSLAECIALPAQSQPNEQFRQVLLDIAARTPGNVLWMLMEKHSDVFDSELIKVFKAGMRAGELDVYLNKYLQQSSQR